MSKKRAKKGAIFEFCALKSQGQGQGRRDQGQTWWGASGGVPRGACKISEGSLQRFRRYSNNGNYFAS